MANMLYNGVELPDINTVWTDKETYPYAYMFYLLPEYAEQYYGASQMYYLHLSQYAYTWDGTRFSNSQAPCLFKGYLSTDGSAWEQTDDSTIDTVGGMGKPANDATVYSWCNTDLVNSDNSVYLAASDPVPVGSATYDKTAFLSGLAMGLCGKGDPTFTGGTDAFTKGYLTGAELRRKRVIPASTPSANGDGFALYNGVKAPALPNYDSVTYPYVVLEIVDGGILDSSLEGDTAYLLSCADKAFYWTGYTYKVDSPSLWSLWIFTDSQAAADAISAYFGVDINPNEWCPFGSGATYTNGMAEPPTWANHNIYDTNNVLYQAASDPIPLDGYTVIEWDGDTTGLEVRDEILYRVSSIVLTESELNNSYISWYYDNQSRFYASKCVISQSESNPDETIISYYGDFGYGEMDFPLGKSAADGLYLISGSGDYVSLFAYKA